MITHRSRARSDPLGPIILGLVSRPARCLSDDGYPTLVVRGGLSYEVKGVTVEGTSTITVVVEDELNKLQAKISELSARVANLE
jgi:hypothetical protein